MNFLKKILLAAIVAVFAGNAEGMAAAPILDFDNIAVVNITSQFQPEWNNAGVANTNAPNDGSEYVYFTIIPAGGIGALGGPGAFVPLNINVPPPAMQRPARPPVPGEMNIYFPMDGRQPTTPEAVSWSCANIDNRPNSPITEWYMQMFGVIPFNANNYIKAGWSVPALGNGAINAQRIISFDTNCAGFPHDQCSVVSYGNAHKVDDPNVPGAQISRRALFEREFRKIASTSVGRVLLYRILIEVRRHIGAGNNNGCQESICVCPDDVTQRARNKHRNVTICWDNDGCAFSPFNNSISICNNLPKLTSIGKSERKRYAGLKNGFTHIVPISNTPMDIFIIHEMLHWFHSLRHKKRTEDEYNNHNDQTGRDNHWNFSNYYVGWYYWQRLNYMISGWNGHMNSAQPWFDDGFIRFEEIRTILGFPSDSADDNYLQGDDLSENLYRMCVGFPLRFGYGYQGFYEDVKVINRVINSCFASYIYYVGGTNTIKRRATAGSEQDFQYDDPVVLRGLGSFRCVNREYWIPR